MAGLPLSAVALVADDALAGSRFDTVVVLDFGSQYSQLIARRAREAGVYSVLVPWDTDWDEIRQLQPKGIILSGGPASVYEPGAPTLPDWVLREAMPVLGICYGMHLMANALDGDVEPAVQTGVWPGHGRRHGGFAPFSTGLPTALDVWMSHGDHVTRLPAGFEADRQLRQCADRGKPRTPRAPNTRKTRWRSSTDPTMSTTLNQAVDQLRELGAAVHARESAPERQQAEEIAPERKIGAHPVAEVRQVRREQHGQPEYQRDPLPLVPGVLVPAEDEGGQVHGQEPERENAIGKVRKGKGRSHIAAPPAAMVASSISVQLPFTHT